GLRRWSGPGTGRTEGAGRSALARRAAQPAARRAPGTTGPARRLARGPATRDRLRPAAARGPGRRRSGRRLERTRIAERWGRGRAARDAVDEAVREYRGGA